MIHHMILQTITIFINKYKDKKRTKTTWLNRILIVQFTQCHSTYCTATTKHNRQLNASLTSHLTEDVHYTSIWHIVTINASLAYCYLHLKTITCNIMTFLAKLLNSAPLHTTPTAPFLYSFQWCIQQYENPSTSTDSTVSISKSHTWLLKLYVM
jgi:hypothetical protein